MLDAGDVEERWRRGGREMEKRLRVERDEEERGGDGRWKG